MQTAFDRRAIASHTRKVNADSAIRLNVAIDQPMPVEEQIESDVQWARLVHIELVPHPGIAHPKAIEADFMMHNVMLELDMRAPLVGCALRRWSVD